jgi:hypothetical protein
MNTGDKPYFEPTMQIWDKPTLEELNGFPNWYWLTKSSAGVAHFPQVVVVDYQTVPTEWFKRKLVKDGHYALLFFTGYANYSFLIRKYTSYNKPRYRSGGRLQYSLAVWKDTMLVGIASCGPEELNKLIAEALAHVEANYFT